MKKKIISKSVGGSSALITAMGELIIPNGTKTIKQYEYRDNVKITTVVIPRSVTKISRGAFENCIKLSCIKGGNGLKEISIRAFKGTALKEVTLPVHLKRVRKYSFSECKELISVEFESNDTVVEEGCFSACPKLHTVMLPMGMNVIPDRMFYGCANLECVALSPNLRLIGEKAFMNCDNLRQLDYYSFTEFHGLMFPDTVTAIGVSAFEGCSGLTSVNYSNSITTIDCRVFGGCSGLTRVTIPMSVAAIGYYSFYSCSGLHQITFEGLTKMDVFDRSFNQCTGLDAIYVPGEYLDTYIGMLPDELNEKLVGF